MFIGIYGVAIGKGIGSGTIIDKDGTVLTCAHAVVDFQGLRASPKGKVCGFLVRGFLLSALISEVDHF